MWLDRFRFSHEHRQTVEQPRVHQIRPTRFSLDLPVSFLADGRTYDGQSVNVSESGLLATFDQLPEVWTDGQLFLEAGEHYLDISARVARVQGNDVAFTFSIATVSDRTAISVLLNSASDRPLLHLP